MAIRVGKWDCKVCGHIGNSGPHTHCGKCGATRPKDVVFYLTDDAKILKNKEDIKKATSGADWICSYCGGNNNTLLSNCQTCNNPRSEKEKVLEERDYTLDEVPDAGRKSRVERVTPEPELKGSAGYFQKIAGALGLGGVFAFLFSFSTTIDVPVVETTWSRTIAVQEYKDVVEEDWQMPSKGRLIESFKAVHHYDKKLLRYETKTKYVQEQVGTRKVVCGQKDLGNGHFKEIMCDEPIYERVEKQYEEPIYERIPVYKTKYKYNIYKWVEIEPLKASGKNSKAYWPDLKPNMKGKPDQFKTGRKQDKYSFTIKDHKDNTHTYSGEYDFWKDLSVGKTLKAEKSTIFGTYKGLQEEIVN